MLRNLPRKKKKKLKKELKLLREFRYIPTLCFCCTCTSADNINWEETTYIYTCKGCGTTVKK
jgi:hypothetical protein